MNNELKMVQEKSDHINIHCQTRQKLINKYITKITIMQKYLDIEEQKLMQLLRKEKSQNHNLSG